ncbi:DUF4249 domain-containing protein [Cecembia rubra]|nr:DUF4249 domain-containing protein [Cecembia rubra]
MILVLLMMFSCRDPFEPDLSDIPVEVLVAEGYIEIQGESIIRLSKTVPVRSTQSSPVISGAKLSLLDSNNGRWEFVEKEEGVYSLNGNFSPSETYQLQIELIGGKVYKTENLQPIISPEIDELGFLRDQNGVEIFVSTKGDEQAQYFLWSYQEYWIFRPGVISRLIYNDGEVRFRDTDERIDLCWKNNLNPKIVLQNAARFEDNRILQRELVLIPNNSEKLTQRYSIEVMQMAISQEAFDFWEILRKNSDDIGGIFSPLPSLIRGNIYNVTDESEPVIGYISMGKSATKRIYIDISDVFPWPVFIPEYEFCGISFQDTIPPTKQALFEAFGKGDRMPARDLYASNGEIIGYFGAPTQCVDCTLRGSNVRPEFWED